LERKVQKPKPRSSNAIDPGEDAAMRLGLSSGIAMIVGFLLNAFLRPMLTVVVVTGIVLFPLFNHGVIDPLWENFASAAGEAKVWALEQIRARCSGFSRAIFLPPGQLYSASAFGL
jgi:uncharacterized membrane protein (Fun14 family)